MDKYKIQVLKRSFLQNCPESVHKALRFRKIFKIFMDFKEADVNHRLFPCHSIALFKRKIIKNSNLPPI